MNHQEKTKEESNNCVLKLLLDCIVRADEAYARGILGDPTLRGYPSFKEQYKTVYKLVEKSNEKLKRN